MDMHSDICYRALQTRDKRFDGRFFTGVVTTGIFCRPVCPASTPHKENCRFFSTASAAMAQGFRPCLRCRPESAPGSPAWRGVGSTVQRALNLINDGVLNVASTEDLSQRLGVSDRHLRRLFREHLGLSPVTVAQTQRVLFACKLMNETSLPLKDIAISAGFGSVRRFNDSMRKLYGKPPRELRGKKSAKRQSASAQQASKHYSHLQLKLAYRPPFDWLSLVRFLQARAIEGVEEVSDDYYRRSIRSGTGVGLLEVLPDENTKQLVVNFYGIELCDLRQAVRKCRQLFDLDADIDAINHGLSRDPMLETLVSERPGLRVPGAWDLFEISVRAILGQQISVKAARTLARRIVEHYGQVLEHDLVWNITHVFPSPEVLAEVDFATIGLTKRRAQSLSALARAFANGEIVLDETADLNEIEACLTQLAGVGPWTAQYIAMRALGEPDAFPKGDLGLIRALEKRGMTCDIASLQVMSENWRPFRAYACLHLWHSLED